MKIPTTRTSLLFKSAIQELAKSGVVPDPEDSVWLHSICERVVSTGKKKIAPFSDPVVEINGVRFYELSVGASSWIEDYAYSWWADAPSGGFISSWTEPNHNLDVLATAYAMAHSRDKDAFSSLIEEEHARLVIRTWALKIPITFKQLKNAINFYIGNQEYIEIKSPNEPPAKSDEPDDSAWGSVICRLCKFYNKSPEYFLWEIGETDFMTLLKNSNNEECQIKKDKSEELEALRLVKKFIAEKGAPRLG